MLGRLLCALALASAAAAPEASCPVKVLGAGFGRTGTNSLMTALDTLGLNSYHMEKLLGTHGGPHIAAWDDHVHGVAPLDFDAILDGYDAAVDFPVGATQVWSALVRDRCPRAKVILTERDSPEAWADSYLATIGTLYDRFPFSLLKHVVPSLGRHERMWLKLVADMVGYDTVRPTTADDRGALVAAYERNSALARELVPADRLLVFNVKQGWAPLCAFLGDVVEGPCPEGPFPRTNDRSEFKYLLAKATGGLVVAPLLGLLGLLYAATLHVPRLLRPKPRGPRAKKRA